MRSRGGSMTNPKKSKLTSLIIYESMVQMGIIVDGEIRANGKSKSGAGMDLCLERSSDLDNFNESGTQAFSLAHYSTAGGDAICELDMIFFYHTGKEKVEAYSYQTSVPPVFEVVYPKPGEHISSNYRELNAFAKQWMENLLEQGHSSSWVDSTFNSAEPSVPFELQKRVSFAQMVELEVINTLTTALLGSTVLSINHASNSIVLDLDEARHLEEEGASILPVEDMTQSLISAGYKKEDIETITHFELYAS